MTMKTYCQEKSRDWERKSERGILPHAQDEVMTPRWNLFQMEPTAYMEKRHFQENLEPRSHWHDGCPLGNGDLGVMAYGPPEAASFLFGKTDLWDWTPFGEANYPSAGFAALRRAAEEKNDPLFRELREKSERQLRDDAPTIKPGGMLRLELFPSVKVKDFRQRLSYANAEVEQTWNVAGDCRPTLASRRQSLSHQPISMTSFVHAARNVLAVHVDVGSFFFHEPVFLSLWRHEDPEMSPPTAHAEDGVAWIRQELPGGQHFVLLLGGDSQAFPLEIAAGRVMAKGKPEGRTITFYATLVTSLDAADPLARARENVADALQAGYEHLRSTHRSWWNAYWRRGYLATPWQDVEKKWYQALYFHACVQRPGCMSPGLQGNWIKEHYPAWNGDFHNNINIQVINWSYFAANRLELGEPFYRFYHELLPRVEKDTRDYFKMRGARYPIAMGPDGAETCPGQFLSAWIGSSGWLAQQFWWHYRYSGDQEFLRQFAYPMLRAAALFYEDYLQEGADGKLSAHPAVFMELMTGVVDGFGANSAWDWPVVIRTFQMVKAAAEALAVDADDQARWGQILAKLSPLPTTEEGIWKEFSDKQLLHMHQWEWAKYMAIFPMELVGEDSGPPEWREQARKSLDDHFAYWEEHGGTPDAAYRTLSNFGIAGPALARMGMARRALAFAEHFCNKQDRYTGAGFIGGRSSHYIQVDAPLMASMFLNEMLLQSFDGILRVFPAAPPSEGPLCFHSLRAQGGFLVSAERRYNLTQYVVLRSLLGNELRLRNPFVGEQDRAVQVKVYKLAEDTDLRDQSNVPALLDRLCFPGDIIAFNTERDGMYLVSKEIPWYSCIPTINVE